jgi:hypothetical protein
MTEPAGVLYGSEPALEASEFRRVLVESGLGVTRPVDDEERLKAMLSGADLIVTARLDEPGRPLVGVARGITDFSWSCYYPSLRCPRPLSVSASARACWTRCGGRSDRGSA